MKTFIITEHNGSYDAYEETPLFSVSSEEEAKAVIELFSGYADWLNKRDQKMNEFQDTWNKDNPQTWRKDEPEKYRPYKEYWRRCKTDEIYRETYKITEEIKEKWEAIQKEQKDFEDRKDKWYKEKQEASKAFSKTLVCPKAFAKINAKFDASYNDHLHYSCKEVDILVLDDVAIK